MKSINEQTMRGAAVFSVLLASMCAGMAHAADAASSSIATGSGALSRIVDGDVSTSWQSAGGLKADDGVLLDRGALMTVSTVDLYMADLKFPVDRIQQGVIEVSADKTNWVAIGSFGNTSEVHLNAPAGTQARYVRVRVTAAQKGKALVREIAIDRQLASASGGSALFSTVGSITDGDVVSLWKSAGAPTPADAVVIDLGRSVQAGPIRLLMSDPASPGGRIQAGVIEVSNDNLTWTPVGEFYNTDDVRVTPPSGATARYVRARPTASQTKPIVIREFSAITSPPQPSAGPGGSDYTHGDMRVTEGGSGYNAWYVFEPKDGPPLTSAPLAIITHGYGEFKGYNMHAELIRHTVRKGTVVIYPRYQTSLIAACPGPFYIKPCVTAATKGIQDALAFLKANPDHVQPDLSKTSYFGHSFGGIITLNLANQHVELGLPVPRAIFLDDPHDGGFAGKTEPAVDKTLAGIPSTTLVECHVGANGVIGEVGKENASCNAIFPKLSHIPPDNKAIVLSYTDTHGNPDLSSVHGVSTGPAFGSRFTVDAYDWNVIWKIWDGLRSAAYAGEDRAFVLGDTPQHRSVGVWSDGVPVMPLKVQHEAPIRP